MALSTILVPGTSASTLYTSSVVSPQIGNAITCMIICNTSGSSVNLTLYAVPNSAGSAGTASTSNMIISALPIPAGETVSLDQEKLVLSNNDTIQGFGSTANALTFTISTLPV
jgi:hypothetical protein